VLGWDPQYLNAIVHGRAAPGATRQASLASQTALLAKQITGLRAEIAGLTQASYRTNMKLEMLIRRIDTLMGPPTRQASPAHGTSAAGRREGAGGRPPRA
jgi:hypothetical protein